MIDHALSSQQEDGYFELQVDIQAWRSVEYRFSGRELRRVLKLERIADVLAIFPGLHAFSASVSQLLAHINTTTGCNDEPSCLLSYAQPSVSVPSHSHWSDAAATPFSDLSYRSRGCALTSLHRGSAYHEVVCSEFQVLLAAGSCRGS